MTDTTDSTHSLLARRKLTRAVADASRTQLVEYLTTLTPLLQPEAVLGEHVQGGRREASRKPADALKELQAMYEALAPAQPLNLRRELTPPFALGYQGVEVSPVDYMHSATANGQSRNVSIRRPLTWTLTYAGYTPARLRELLTARSRQPEELQQAILSYLLMHLLTTHQPSLMQLLAALHFPVTTTTMPEFGELPITRIGIDISTSRPPDAVVVESAELTGIDAFEELINVAELSQLHSPFMDRLLDIAQQHSASATT